MRRDKATEALLVAVGVPVVIWIALLVAPSLYGERAQLLEGLLSAFDDPFSVVVVEGSLKVVAASLVAYALAIGIFYSTRRNWRRREEHGSARWGEARAISRRYRDGRYSHNRLFTKDFRLGLDIKRHKRNLNALVVGGSGAGKTRGFCKPNVMQANTSFVILDPKGEILRDTGHLLERQGYRICVLDLVNMERSHCYNPFVCAPVR